jgi:hypothetical protein
LLNFCDSLDDKSIGSKSMQHRRRPRALTLTLPDAKQPFLVLDGIKYTLRNVSQEGIGLWVMPPLPFGLTTGSQVSGDIVIDTHIHPVVLEIVHHSPRVIGLRIVEKSRELEKLFRRLLEPANYAGEMEPHAKDGSEDADNGFRRVWYAGPSDTELLVWYADPHRMIAAIQLCWRGSWVYRQQFKPTQTGHLRDGERKRPGHKLNPKDLLIVHDHPDESLITEAAQFLGAVPSPLPGYRLWQFLEMGEQVFLPAEYFSHKQRVA